MRDARCAIRNALCAHMYSIQEKKKKEKMKMLITIMYNNFWMLFGFRQKINGLAWFMLTTFGWRVCVWRTHTTKVEHLYFGAFAHHYEKNNATVKKKKKIVDETDLSTPLPVPLYMHISKYVFVVVPYTYIIYGLYLCIIFKESSYTFLFRLLVYRMQTRSRLDDTCFSYIHMDLFNDNK